MTYGNIANLPLIGGSGGCCTQVTTCQIATGGGAAGGGALLLAATGVITVTGTLRANGGNFISEASGGSGGAIRLVADVVDGAGFLRAIGGSGNASAAGSGRIRVEANDITLADPGNPVYTIGTPGSVATIFPDDKTAPTVRVVSVHDQSVPDDPNANLDFPKQDVGLNLSGAATVLIEAKNVPLDWIVKVRAVPKSGGDTSITATFDSGDETLSYWTADITFPNGFSTIQARAAKP